VHDPGSGGGLVRLAPKHHRGIGWVKFDQVDVLNAVANGQSCASVGGADVGCPVCSGEAFEEVAVVVDGDDGDRGASGRPVTRPGAVGTCKVGIPPNWRMSRNAVLSGLSQGGGTCLDPTDLGLFRRIIAAS
jgi:hypothetical protein